MSMVPVVWATFGIFSVRSKWFPVAIGYHGRNLILSLWPGDKATINEVAVWRLTPCQKIPIVKIRYKISCLNFWDQDGILFIDCIPKGQTINAEYYSSLLVQLKEKHHGKVSKAVLFLHDNAPAHQALATQKTLAYLGFQCLDHPPCSPDLAPITLPPVPWTENTIERPPFFVQHGGHCCRGDLVGWTAFWIFFEWPAKVRVTG